MLSYRWFKLMMKYNQHVIDIPQNKEGNIKKEKER
jgi:hypothetical protein